jgi:hypothetical protein
MTKTGFFALFFLFEKKRIFRGGPIFSEKREKTRKNQFC